MIGLLVFISSLVFGSCVGMSPRAKSVWPIYGYNLCGYIVYQPTRESCIQCFKEADTDWVAASQCVDAWLPPKFADCADSGDGNSGNGNNGNGNSGNGNGNSGNGNNGNSGNGGGQGNENRLIACLKKAVNDQTSEMKRAQTLYERGGKYLQMVSDSNIIDGGGAAIFSSFAQDLILNQEQLETDLAQSSSGCFGRFQLDPINERWHIHKDDLQRSVSRQAEAERIQNPKKSLSKILSRSSGGLSSRNIVYQYGLVGNDMPFHGVGPLAIDILKGDCVFNSMAEYESLDTLTQAMLDSELPVAAWIFQELLDQITSVNLP